MPEAAIPLVAEEAVGTTAAELAAQQAAAAAAAEAASQAAAVQAAEQAAAQQAAEQAAQAATEQATTGGISDLVQPTTAPVNPAAPVQTAPLAQAGPAIPPTAPVQSTPLQPPPGTPPAAPPPAAPPPPTAPTVEPPPAQPSFNYNQTANFPEVQSPRITSFQPPSTAGLGGAPSAYPLGTGAETDAGIQALAKEVGAQSTMPGVDTTLTQYASGAPGSSALPSATPFNPAAPMANPTYAQPSGLQGLQTNLSGPLGSNLPPPSVPQVVTSAGTGAPPETDILKQMINPNGAERFAGTQNLIENPASVPSDMYTKESLRVPLDEQLGRMPTEAVPNTTIPAQAATPASDAMSGIKGLWKDFKDMPLKDKALTGLMASSAYQMMNQPKPYEKPKYKSTWNAGAYSGYQPVQPTPYTPQYAHGGLADLGGYSDGGRMLKGPGDGMSDDIPATIANKQPARLANEEFVVPADVVSHLGNGSSEAGAKQLYKMMDRVRQARTGNKKQGKQINPEKYLA